MENPDRRSLLGFGVSTAALSVFPVTAARARTTGTVDPAKLLQPPPLGDRSMGDPQAAVTMIEYGSTASRRCARFSNDTLPALKTAYIDTGKLRFIFREFPYDDLAMVTFMLLRCAPEDRYFPLLGVLFERQQRWERRPQDELLKIFEAHGFSEKKYKGCVENTKLRAGIKDGMLHAERAFHVNSTPTFFINGNEVVGTRPVDTFSAMIDTALQAAR